MPDIKPPSPPPNPFKKVGAKANRATFLALAALILAVGAATLSWFSWAQSELINHKISLLAADMTQEEKGYVQTLQTTSQALKQQVNALEKSMNALQDQVNSLSSSNLTAKTALQQAVYLIKMANLQLSIGGNTKTAVELLNLAKQQLDKTSHSSTQAIQQLIKKHINLLKKTPAFNPEKLITQLNELNQAIYALPILPTSPLTQSTTADKNPPSSTTSSWQAQFKHMTNSLKNLVIIRHNNQPIKSLLSAEQLALLKESIRLNINSAQWAVIHQDTALYHQSLKSAKNWLQTYYPNQKNTTKILATLEDLMQVDIKQKTPNLADLLTAIENITVSVQNTSSTKKDSEGN